MQAAGSQSPRVPLEILKFTGDLGKVYEGIFNSVIEIAEHLRYSTSNKIQTMNEFGDVQLDQDVQTDSLIFESLKNTGMVYAGLSEERSYVTQLDDNGKWNKGLLAPHQRSPIMIAGRNSTIIGVPLMDVRSQVSYKILKFKSSCNLWTQLSQPRKQDFTLPLPFLGYISVDVQLSQVLWQELNTRPKINCKKNNLFDPKGVPEWKYNDNFMSIVTFDPLDGSSIIDTNGAIGSIFAIWPNGDLNTMTGRDIVGAALACYGSRTNILYINPDTKQVDEATLQLVEKELQWVISRKNIRIKTEGKFFSPGNTRSIQYNLGYRDAIQFWSRNGYILRYSGGMAPDCYHIFAKNEGIFSSVSAEPKVGPKLRLLYECAPIAYLIEQAGGLSSNGTISVLDIKVKGYTQKCDIIIGSREDVERVQRFLAKGSEVSPRK